MTGEQMMFFQFMDTMLEIIRDIVNVIDDNELREAVGAKLLAFAVVTGESNANHQPPGPFQGD